MTPPGRPLDVSGLNIGGTLRGIINTVLPEGGQRTARRNAWEAVCADRVRARGREEAWLELDRVAAMDAAMRGHASSMS